MPSAPVSGPSGVSVPGPPVEQNEPRVRTVEQAVRRGPRTGWRKFAKVVPGGGRGKEAEQDAIDADRTRTVFDGCRRIVVLGCTGGAGQTVTAMMMGHTLASIRDDRVVAVDANPGGKSLGRRARNETPETLTTLLAHITDVGGYLAMRAYTSQSQSHLEVIASDQNIAATQALDDRAYSGLVHLLDRYYKITLVDPSAAGVARVLPHADQLVLVAPASGDAARAVAMTLEWLDGHGYADLRSRAVVAVNGVSKRSQADVERAESVARGRCRAIVRIPWDDHLSADRGNPAELDDLRSVTRRSYTALAGIVASGLAGMPDRTDQEASQ